MLERRSTGVALEADGTVRILELTAGLRTVTLSRRDTFLPEADDPFTSWRQGLEKARASGLDPDSAVVGLTDCLTYRKALEFPFRSRKRIVQILESELEGEIPVASDSVVADFLPGPPMEKGIRGIAIACSRQTLSRVLEIFGGGIRLKGLQTLSAGLATVSRASGVREGVVAACPGGEGLLLEIRSASLASIRRISLEAEEDDPAPLLEGMADLAAEGDEGILVCPDHAPVGGELQADAGALRVRRFSDLSLPVLTPRGDRPDPRYAIPLGLALRGLGRRGSLGLDLRQGPFKQVSPLSSLKTPLQRTAALGLVVGLLLVIGLAVQTGKARSTYGRYSRQLEAEFRKSFPDMQYREEVAVNLVSERLERLQNRMAEISGFTETGVLSALARLSSAIPEGINLKIDEFSYDSKKIRLEGTVPTFDAVDRVKMALEEDPFFTAVQVQNARIGADVNKVTFRLQMEVR